MNALVLIIALMLDGECGPIQDNCRLEVLRVLTNRVGAPGFANSIGDVLDGFYARADAPTPEAIRVARLLWIDPGSVRDGRYYYVWSDDDRRRMGWPAGDEVLCGAGLCVNLGRTWPGG